MNGLWVRGLRARAAHGAGAAVTAVRLRSGIHRYAMRVLDALGHAPLMGDDGRAPRTVEIGPDPIRVLVFGGGLAVGNGVRSRQEAFDAPLARLIAERSGRGVIIENRAVQHIRLHETAASLGAVGGHTYHAMIWCPSFAEGLERLRLSSWREGLARMIDELRSAETVPIVLTHMPLPAGRHPAAVIARPWVHRLNRVIDDAARAHERVAAVPTEPFIAAEIGQQVTGPAYFAAVAEHLAAPVLDLLGIRPLATPSAR